MRSFNLGSKNQLLNLFPSIFMYDFLFCYACSLIKCYKFWPLRPESAKSRRRKTPGNQNFPDPRRDQWARATSFLPGEARFPQASKQIRGRTCERVVPWGGEGPQGRVRKHGSPTQDPSGDLAFSVAGGSPVDGWGQPQQSASLIQGGFRTTCEPLRKEWLNHPGDWARVHFQEGRARRPV